MTKRLVVRPLILLGALLLGAGASACLNPTATAMCNDAVFKANFAYTSCESEQQIDGTVCEGLGEIPEECSLQPYFDCIGDSVACDDGTLVEADITDCEIPDGCESVFSAGPEPDTDGTG